MKVISLKVKGIVATLIALSTSFSFACMCIFMGAFADFSKLHPNVVRGTVIGYGEELQNQSNYFKTMTVTVTESIKGAYPHDEVRFRGDTGMSCLRYITRDDYPIGSEHLFILESDYSS